MFLDFRSFMRTSFYERADIKGIKSPTAHELNPFQQHWLFRLIDF
jgi:hypothetical protein